MLPPAQPRTHKLFRPMISLIPYLLIRLSLRFYSILFKSGGICNIHTKKHEWNGVNRLYKDPPVGKLADKKKKQRPTRWLSQSSVFSNFDLIQFGEGTTILL